MMRRWPPRAWMTMWSPGRIARCGFPWSPLTSTRPRWHAVCACERVLKRHATSSQMSRRTVSVAAMAMSVAIRAGTVKPARRPRSSTAALDRGSARFRAGIRACATGRRCRERMPGTSGERAFGALAGYIRARSRYSPRGPRDEALRDSATPTGASRQRMKAAGRQIRNSKSEIRNSKSLRVDHPQRGRCWRIRTPARASAAGRKGCGDRPLRAA